jgi:hypothetical protein
VGAVAFTRRYWKCTCGADGSYAADAILGAEGQRYTKAVQRHCCRLAADRSFASASEHLHEMLGVDLCPETVRKVVEGHGQKMAASKARIRSAKRPSARPRARSNLRPMPARSTPGKRAGRT